MHVMLKRAAASAIPALLGLAISPATAMAAPQSGPVIGGSAHGVITYGKDTILHNYVYAVGPAGIDNRRGLTASNGITGTAGNSVNGRVKAVAHP
jgi:hypothetical protein